MKVQLSNTENNTLTMERDLYGNLIIQHRTTLNEVSQFVVEAGKERTRLAEMIEAL